MTLDQLRIFVAVAERLHVTQAAEVLHLSQAAVSAAIAKLEDRHSVRLFDRIGRGIALTDAGAVLLPEARAILGAAESASILLGDMAGNPRGHLRIHASQTIATYWLPLRLIEMKRRHPEVILDFQVGNSAQVTEAVQSGIADIGLVENGGANGHLEVRTVAEDRLVLVMGKHHLWASRETIAVEDYPDSPWILREEGSGTRAVFEAFLASRGLGTDALSVTLTFPTNEAILAALGAGRHVSAMSLRAVDPIAASRWVVVHDIPGARRNFTLLTDPRRYRTHAAEAMIRVLCDTGHG